MNREEVRRLACEAMPKPATASVPVDRYGGLVLAQDVSALVDCPSAPCSRMDGFALRAADTPGELRVAGSTFAGSNDLPALAQGQAIRITTGGRIPEGADAVVKQEDVVERSGFIRIDAQLSPGQYVVPSGDEVERGASLATRGEVVTHTIAGRCADGGIAELLVHPRPRVALLAIGDELVAPGMPLRPGQRHASNSIRQRVWLEQNGFPCDEVRYTRDEDQTIGNNVRAAFVDADVLITSGGSWKSERDRAVPVLESLGAQTIFRGLGTPPAKSTALLLLNKKPVFCLPGRAKGNAFAFEELIIPCLQHLSGTCRV